MKINPKNSELNKKRMPAALQNANIKYKTDSTGYNAWPTKKLQ